MKSITWCRQEIGEGCLLTDEHIHIAIRSPEGRTIAPRCRKETLHLSFLDMVPADIRAREIYKKEPKKGEELCALCFRQEHAALIKEFLGNKPQDVHVVVNCEAGISRSAGVALVLRTLYGGDIPEIHIKAYPNLHVADMLGKEFGLGPFERPPSDLELGGSLFS